ncbi:MAG TPA: ABC transporter ATP-binding protein [Stellaceae bacterium]|nr:ABC transporter ATP-binding protein [Stellaceae bacterium]
MALLEIGGLVKSFDRVRPVLGPLDIVLEEGRLAAVVGRSGCGKSTLLRCLAGLEKPSAGTIRLAGAPVRPEDVAVVFQEPRLMPWLTVAQNIGFGLRHLPARERAAAVGEALEVVGLTEAARLLPKALSGGMAQRVALARALAVRPRLLLLDEPFSALDPLTRTAMQAHLLTLWQHYGPTVVLVSHDMEEALALADRIVVLDGPPGRVVGEFSPGMPHPRHRSGPHFQRWRDRLIGALEQRPRLIDEVRDAV